MRIRHWIAITWISILVLFSASCALAATIKVTLTIPDVSGTIGPTGAEVPFTADSVTFSATGDTTNLYQKDVQVEQFRLKVWTLDAPIGIDVPGVLSASASPNQSGVTAHPSFSDAIPTTGPGRTAIRSGFNVRIRNRPLPIHLYAPLFLRTSSSRVRSNTNTNTTLRFH